jgi:hypothetical protein
MPAQERRKTFSLDFTDHHPLNPRLNLICFWQIQQKKNFVTREISYNQGNVFEV